MSLFWNQKKDVNDYLWSKNKQLVLTTDYLHLWYFSLNGGVITWPIQDDPMNMTKKFEHDGKIQTNEP